MKTTDRWNFFRLPWSLQGDRFKLATQAFDRQYAHIYFQRLMLMKPPLLTKVRQKWPGIQCESSLQDTLTVVTTVSSAVN